VTTRSFLQHDGCCCNSSCSAWLCNFPNWRMQKRLSRRRFKLQALGEGEALVDDLLQQRLQKPTALQKGVICICVSRYARHSSARSSESASSQRAMLSLSERTVRQTCTVCGNHICTYLCTLSVQCDECLDETATVLSALTQRSQRLLSLFVFDIYGSTRFMQI